MVYPSHFEREADTWSDRKGKEEIQPANQNENHKQIQFDIGSMYRLFFYFLLLYYFVFTKLFQSELKIL